MKHYTFLLHTVISELTITVSKNGINEIHFSNKSDAFSNHPITKAMQITTSPDVNIPQYIQDLIHEVSDQLEKYFQGRIQNFDVPIDLSGKTLFQKKVLQATQKIPYGQTSSYKDIAIQVGNPKAARAVGNVEATNNIPIIIPCHRVVGSDGKLHGYSAPGGLKLKAFLLSLEKENLTKAFPLR